MDLRTPRRTLRAGLFAGLLAPLGPLSLACEGGRERAEPPPEPTIVVPGDDGDGAAGNIRLAGGVDFDGGLRIDEITYPARARPGDALRVTMMIHGLDSPLRARAGLRTPRSAGWEEARGRGGPPPEDPRDVFVDVELAAGPVGIELVLPPTWHPATAVLELDVRDGERRRRARRGARTQDGRALLAVVDVERRPTAVAAERGTPTLDGVLDDPIWRRPAAALVDSRDGEPFRGQATEVWFAWDAQHLYVAGRLEDDDLWSTFERQDDPLYKQEAFEIFIAGDDSGRRYLELQVSARGVTFDARFPTYRRGDEAWDSRWRTAVSRSGTVNDARDRDRGWSVEAAIPWAEICAETAVACPPAPGLGLRANVFRLDHPGRKEAVAVALSPTLRPDFHAWENAAVLELR